MKAYKFRTTNNFDNLIDILLNKRLYCADFKDLSDVFEADIRTGKDIGREKEFIAKMKHFQELVKGYRVCSLTKTLDNHLLWAYYANGHTGVAIEIELSESEDNVYGIEYLNDLLFFSDLIDDYENPQNIYKPLLLKRSSWEHEQEVRILTKDKYFDIKHKITGVIAGTRMNPTTQVALDILCAKIGIPFYRAVIADWGIYTVGYQKNYEPFINEK
jgi:Protein of unknown function (DUF2971)